MHLCILSSTVHNSQDMEMPTDRGRDKEKVEHTCNWVLLSHEKEKLLFAAKWMQLEIILLSEVKQIKTNTMWYYLLWNLNYGTNEPIYKTETDLQS